MGRQAEMPGGRPISKFSEKDDEMATKAMQLLSCSSSCKLQLQLNVLLCGQGGKVPVVPQCWLTAFASARPKW